MKKIFIPLMLLCFFNLAIASPPQVKAIVNEEIITALDVKNRFDFFTAFYNLDRKNAQQAIQEQILQSLIDEVLVAQEAKKFKLTVKPQELESYIANLEKVNNHEKGSLLKEIKRKHLNEAEAWKYFKSKILFYQLIDYRLRPMINVNNKEIEEVLGTLIPENTKVHFKQIIISPQLITSEEKEEQYLELLNTFRYKIKRCQDVEAMAAKENLNVTDLTLPINNLHQDLRNMIRILPIGIPSPIIKSNIGPQIIIVCNRDYSGLSDADKEQVKYMIIDKKLEKQAGHYLSKLRQKAYIEINR